MNQKNENFENLWTIKEVADFLQVKGSIIKYWLRTSFIPYIKVGKYYRFDPMEIRAWVENLKNKPVTPDLCQDLKLVM